MKFLLSQKSIGTIAFLMLLSLTAFASIAMPVNAAPRIKVPNVLIDGSGSVELTWKSGKNQTYSSSSDVYTSLGRLDTVTFIPTNGWYISLLEINGDMIALSGLDEDGFSLFNVKAKNIAVTFEANPGFDDVDPEDLNAYPTPVVGLIFDNVLAGGLVSAFTIGLEPPDAIGASWDIQTDAIFDQTITVILLLTFDEIGTEDPTELKMWRTDVELARSDVTLDGEVNGDDVSDVANANPSEDGDLVYESRLDLNDDGFIDNTDVNIVNNYIGMQVWEDITTDVIVDTDLEIVYVYGVTDRFSIFGVR
jgi:hypothetical protein